MSDSYLLLLIFRKSEGISNVSTRKDESCTREDNLDGASSVLTVYSRRDAFSFFFKGGDEFAHCPNLQCNASLGIAFGQKLSISGELSDK